MKTNENVRRGTEISVVQRIMQVLVIVFFIPVLIVSSLSIYIFSSTKLNSGLPSGFGKTVVTLKSDLDDFKNGQKVLVTYVSVDQIAEGDYVAFYVPEENQPSTENADVMFDKVTNIVEQDGKKNFGFSSQQYYIIDDAVIGIYEGESPFLTGVLQFFSSQTEMIFLGLLPLFLLLVALAIDIIEQFSYRRMNKEIDNAIMKANQAGFDTGYETNPMPKIVPVKVETVSENQTMARPSLPPRREENVTPIKPALPPKKAPVLPEKPNSVLPKKPLPTKPDKK